MMLQRPMFVRKYVVIRRAEYLQDESYAANIRWTWNRDLALQFDSRYLAQRRVRKYLGSRVGQVEVRVGTRVPQD